MPPPRPAPPTGKTKAQIEQENAAAMTLQAGYRGMKARQHAIALQTEKTYDGKVMATLPNTLAWKIVGKEAEFLGQCEARIIKTVVGATSQVCLAMSRQVEAVADGAGGGHGDGDRGEGGDGAAYKVTGDDDTDFSQLFPMPLRQDIPVTKHSKVYFVLPTVGFSDGIFVGLKLDDKNEAFVTFLAALELSANVVDSANLQKAKERGEKIKLYAEKGSILVKKAGSKAAAGVSKLGGYLKTKLKPKEEDTKVSASTKKTVAAVAVGAQKGAQVSGMAVQMMSTMTQAMASSIAEGVQSTDYYRSIKNGKKKRNPPSSTATQAKVVAGSAILGFDMLVEAMFAASEEVLEQAGETSVDVITHRHGEEAGVVAGDAAHAAVDGTKTAMNLAKIGPKALVKGAAKGAGKELVKDAI